jgi:sphingolipid delta-4 desaturase
MPAAFNSHRHRGRALVRAHPELLALMGPRPVTALWIAAVATAQLVLAAFLARYPWWAWLGGAYVIGAVLNLALWTLLHECTHDLVFKRKRANCWLGIVAGLPVGLPVASAFRNGHLLHHRHPDDPLLDLDVPSAWEARWTGRSAWRKATWLLFGAALQAARSFRVKDRAIYDRWYVATLATQAAFNVLVIYAFGWQALAYLLAATAFAVGLHPLGGRLLQEHYPIDGGPPTASYYGPLNRLVFNAGYHNEHHDLMRVPWMNLTKLRRTAPEFYRDLPAHRSWTALLLRFVRDPSLGPDCRLAKSFRRSPA